MSMKVMMRGVIKDEDDGGDGDGDGDNEKNNPVVRYAVQGGQQ